MLMLRRWDSLPVGKTSRFGSKAIFPISFIVDSTPILLKEVAGLELNITFATTNPARFP